MRDAWVSQTDISPFQFHISLNKEYSVNMIYFQLFYSYQEYLLFIRYSWYKTIRFMRVISIFFIDLMESQSATVITEIVHMNDRILMTVSEAGILIFFLLHQSFQLCQFQIVYKRICDWFSNQLHFCLIDFKMILSYGVAFRITITMKEVPLRTHSVLSSPVWSGSKISLLLRSWLSWLDLRLVFLW